MAKFIYRSPTPTTKPYGYGHTHDSVAGLQVIQYRSYQRDVSIYHLRTHLLSLRHVYAALQSQDEFVEKLTSFDPLHNAETTEGDEILHGCIEAAYLPSILHGHGSALALRTQQSPGRVEWFIFSGPMDQSCLDQLVASKGNWSLASDVAPGHTHKVFDLVGFCEKGLTTRRVRGANREHKGWHDSLCRAEERKIALKLTWKGFGTTLRREHERRRVDEIRRYKLEAGEELLEEETPMEEQENIGVGHGWQDGQKTESILIRVAQSLTRERVSWSGNALPLLQKP